MHTPSTTSLSHPLASASLLPSLTPVSLSLIPPLHPCHPSSSLLHSSLTPSLHPTRLAPIYPRSYSITLSPPSKPASSDDFLLLRQPHHQFSSPPLSQEEKVLSVSYWSALHAVVSLRVYYSAHRPRVSLRAPRGASLNVTGSVRSSGLYRSTAKVTAHCVPQCPLAQGSVVKLLPLVTLQSAREHLCMEMGAMIRKL